ncbi:C3a anaphylatoxin chemotactic receptor-like [Engystomops pustulosus]|uniref:C3a anaphylatoxin chemotactic receptor-like n=1 Tax=Engystomops pustulosus TaxID=76066 RepID=UPI003AFA86F3
MSAVRMYPEDYDLTSPDTPEYLGPYNLSSDENYKTNYTTADKMDVIQIVKITLYSIIFILGIIGNGLVIWIAGFRMKKTISAVWFLNLAIADFLCCTSLPIIIAGLVSDDMCRSSSSFLFCFFYDILLRINMTTCSLLLTAMSVDRWVSVMWPFWAKVHRTQKLVRITAGIIWVFSILWVGLIIFLTEILPIYRDESFTETMTILLIRVVLMFVIPFLIIFTSYVTICIKLRKSNRPQRSQRPYRIITAVILCFFICWAPYYIHPLTVLYSVYYFMVDSIILILVYLNSCINPIIYVFMGQDFRHNFLRSIPFRVEKALSEPPDDPGREQENLNLAPTAGDHI